MADKTAVLLALPGKVTIEKSEALRANLVKLKGRYTTFLLDFRKVEEIDLAGIQVVIAFLLDCTSGGFSVGCRGPLNRKIRRTLEISGLLAADEEGEYLFPFVNDKGVKVELN